MCAYVPTYGSVLVTPSRRWTPALMVVAQFCSCTSRLLLFQQLLDIVRAFIAQSRASVRSGAAQGCNRREPHLKDARLQNIVP